ncbi:bifunctional ADP-dependent NAD(P)H-hydrate dehydratase/NAD(P)H-hydrate epimerase [Spirosoma horti]
MERAALTFVDWFVDHFSNKTKTKIFCGLGNNGGDGLAIARLLLEREYPIDIFVVRYAPRESDDFMHNHRRLKLVTENVHYIESATDIPAIRHNDVVIDAILGSGLSRPTEGIVSDTIKAINRAPATVVSVDIASGLYTDQPNSPTDVIIEPDYTLSFQLPKLAFMMPQNGPYVGDWQLLDIRLHKRFIDLAPTPYYFTQPDEARLLLHKRDRFSNKGTFGHALLLVGSYGKIGAAVLAARACLRSGVGLLTVQVPQCGYTIVQTSVPEAMCSPDRHQNVLTGTAPAGHSGNESIDPADYSTIGVGPGIGKAPETLAMLKGLLPALKKPIVVDADALNLLAENRESLANLPKNSILTPHPKEFQRLTRKWNDDYEKLTLLREFAKKYQVVVILKGAHSAITTPDGDIHFNSTGNPGLSTGGTGDVLTGILTALLAQGYDPVEAAVLGVFAHGLAGDRVAQQRGPIGMTASDVIDALRWE